VLKLKENREVVILKLGGSLLTDKNKPFSLRKEIIDSTISQIIKSKKKIVLIHGGGSFGHPIAKKYNISNGKNSSIGNQLYGLAETHKVMNDLNTIIINKFLEKNVPAISFQPSSIFINALQEISKLNLDVIEIALDLGILPVLYGDIMFDIRGSFSILSGDRIILELCKNFLKYKVSKVIFAIEKDGIFVKESKNGTDVIKLAKELKSVELDNISLAQLDEKVDVTGGIRGKINSIKDICQFNVPVQVINGLKEEYVFRALNSLELECTNINPYFEKKESKTIISDRKLAHLKIPIEHNVQHTKNYFKYINFIHCAVPEVDFEEIDLSVNFFNKIISAPICISAITGGHPVSKEINKILAQAAEKENIIMSVGSQRAALIDPSLKESFSIVREVAPNIPIIGNIGIGQLSNSKFEIGDFNNCVNMIKADVIAIHLNPLHELVQIEGDRSYKLFKDNFEKIRINTRIPIIAKEVGSGINKECAISLDELGFDGFDVGGAGGTSFAAIEAFRNKEIYEIFTRNPADVFREWGIPTPVSIYYVRSVSNKLIIATGGLNTGLDIAKSIAMGADIGGFAYKFLLSAWKDYKNGSISNTIKEIQTLKNELRSCLWLTNVKNIGELKQQKNKIVIFGKLKDWMKSE